MATIWSSYSDTDERTLEDVQAGYRSAKLAYDAREQEHYARRKFRQSMRATLSDLTVCVIDFNADARDLSPLFRADS